MADTSVARVPLGAPTSNRKWFLDIDSAFVGDETDPPAWIGVFGIMEFQNTQDPSLQDVSDFESGGWKSQAVMGLAWTAVPKLKRASLASDRTKYDPGQEILRKASLKVGIENLVRIRFYEMEPNGPRVEAYQGLAVSGWSPDGGAMDAASTVTSTLTGYGRLEEITHPASAE
ncbi:major tail protein [Curtobacterium phage Parvaparticeps]|nr:major tail protein [Curtobacterium phage Parvaparticeps]